MFNEFCGKSPQIKVFYHGKCVNQFLPKTVRKTAKYFKMVLQASEKLLKLM